EPVWRREHISNIEITIAEDLGVERRGAFYDKTGALRDMVQNHALQLLCALAMEPPINAHADAIRDEKLKVLRSLKRWTPEPLDLDFDKRFGSERVGAYERLLLDVIAGRLNLFVRSDEQEAAWRWVEPIMEHWAADERGPRPYGAGTWGPSSSSAMIARDG